MNRKSRKKVVRKLRNYLGLIRIPAATEKSIEKVCRQAAEECASLTEANRNV
ncbi:hypothetical protein V2P20_09160 [Methylobacter sp. Wu1]|uniref:hypothetical protein n=1 Tax=Methylobacter sp. Wu1 TaxID=3119359 RepID=UPI002F94F586